MVEQFFKKKREDKAKGKPETGSSMFSIPIMVPTNHFVIWVVRAGVMDDKEALKAIREIEEGELHCPPAHF